MVNEKVKVLTVDDYEDNLIILSALIEEAYREAEVFEATEGRSAIEIARKIVPDVIILDVFMPDMDGFEVCRQLKKEEGLKDIPVLFVTAAKGSSDIRIKALEVGAEGFLAKPIDESELTAQIASMLKIRKANLEKQSEKKRLAEMVQEKTVELIEAGEKQGRLMEKLKIENLQRRKNEEALAEAKKEAEEANRVQSIFLSNMSHEVRTPLNGIIGMLDMTLMTALTKEQKDYLTAAKASAGNLLGILNDILDYSKIEANKLEIRNKWTNIRDEVAMTVRLFEKAASDKNLLLSWHIDEAVPALFFCDPLRLNQIMGNLVSNAIKFTDQGSVSVGVSLDGKDGDNQILSFAVRDSGIGIAEEKKELIFKRFSQIDAREKDGIKGSGLGLAITKNLVALMGGSISFESQYKGGSVFTFKLKGKTKAKAMESDKGARIETEAKGDQAEDRAKRLLIVDDDPVNRKLMKAYLEKKGYGIISAESGRRGLGYLMDNQVDLILMDLSMPDMDGFQTLSAMKQHKPGIPAIAMTAYSETVFEERTAESGFDGYISKPIDFEVLQSMMVGVLNKG